MNTFLSTYYTKSIRLSPNGFSLFSHLQNDNLQQETYNYSDNILLGNVAPPFFSLDQNDVKPLDIVVATHIPMLIPEVMFEDKKCTEYLQLQFNTSQLDQVYNDTIGHYRAVYFLNKTESSMFQRLAMQPNFKSESSLIYQFLLEENPNESLFLSVNNTFADIFVMQCGEPILVNRTPHVNPEDLLYYTIFCIQQLGLSHPTLYVNYFGKSNKKLNELLAQYVKPLILL